MAELVDRRGAAACWLCDQSEETEVGGERVWLDQKHSWTEADQTARGTAGGLGVSVCGSGLQLGTHEKVVTGGGVSGWGGGALMLQGGDEGRKKQEAQAKGPPKKHQAGKMGENRGCFP